MRPEDNKEPDKARKNDVNGDGKLGLPGAIYIFQKAAGVR